MRVTDCLVGNSNKVASTPCLKKTVQIVFVRASSNFYTNFHNFWQNDGKVATIMQGALIFHLT